MKRVFALLIAIALLTFAGCPESSKSDRDAKGGGKTTSKTKKKSGAHASSSSPDEIAAQPAEDEKPTSVKPEDKPKPTPEPAKVDPPVVTPEPAKVDPPVVTPEPAKVDPPVVTPEPAKVDPPVEAPVAVNMDQYKPKLFANLPDNMPNPDGMTVSEKTGNIFMCVPNFNVTEGEDANKKPKKVYPAMLVKVSKDGSVEKLLEFAPLEVTGQTGCMGLDFGPDGNLYVCDNQFFYNNDYKSRILRVVMDADEKPTQTVQVVIEGLKLPNALLWTADNLYFTDTFLQLDEKVGYGGLWRFTKDEVLLAGTDEAHPTLKVAPNGTDAHLVLKEAVNESIRKDQGGADGMTVDSEGVIYFGNFGDGAMYRVTFDAEGKALSECIHKGGEVFNCCDGIFYDKARNKIYINDSQKNAIRAFTPVKAGEKPVFETLWQNADTDGTDGLLDQPCECAVTDNKLVIANFDWPFPELDNKNTDKPYTLSVIELK